MSGKAKAASFPFYPTDWTADMQAQSLEARGAWITILASAWIAPIHGVVVKTPRQWARLFGEKVKDAMRIISELAVEGVCDVYVTDDPLFRPATERQGDEERVSVSQGVQAFSGECPADVPVKIAVVSRRMLRAELTREYERLKKQDQRRDKASGQFSGECPADVPVDVPVDVPGFSTVLPLPLPLKEEKKQITSPGDPAPGDVSPDKGMGKKPCPHQKIIDLYHEVLPELPRVKIWEGSREQQLRHLWNGKEERQSLDYWRGFFGLVRRCPFLMGEKTDFKANLEWLTRKKNFPKVIEGNYLEKKREKSKDGWNSPLGHAL